MTEQQRFYARNLAANGYTPEQITKEVLISLSDAEVIVADYGRFCARWKKVASK